MGDVEVDKKSKLANTKKRFKELQELKKKRNDNGGSSSASNQSVQENVSSNSAQSSSRNTPVEPKLAKPLQDVKTSLNTKAFEFFGEAMNSDESKLQLASDFPKRKSITSLQENQESALPYYFNPPKDQSPTAFFDNISPTNISEQAQNAPSPSLLTYFNTSHESGAENIGLPRYFENANSNETIWENTVSENKKPDKVDYELFPKYNKSPEQQLVLTEGEEKDEDALSLDYPEIKQNEISEYVNPTKQLALKENEEKEDVLGQEYPEIKQKEISEYVRQSAEDLALGPSSVAQYYENHLENLFPPKDNQKLMEYLGTTGATEEEKSGICHTNEEIDSSSNLTKKEIQEYNNAESLRQLSDQLAQMIEPNYEHSSSGSITDLEKRNLELAANLHKEKTNSEQLRAENSELKLRITHLEKELPKQESGSKLPNSQEVIQMKNELQTHLQTIGLLVAEKTELSSNLSQHEISSKQKTTECEELQARLRASRSRVADLERELNNLKSEKSKSETVEEQYSTTLKNLQHEYRVLKDQKDELAQDLLEVREKLKNTLEENINVQQDNKDLAGKLTLTEIKIQQLSSGGALGIDSQVEQLVHEKYSLESEKANLNQMLKSIIKERDESTVQYQQYAQQLSAQISNLSSKMEQLQREKENLVVQEQNRIKHIGELERQLQNLQDDQVTYATRNSSNSDLRNELEKSRELCVQLQIEKTTTDENYTKVSNEKELSLKELQAKTDSISQLESMIEQLRGNQPDSVKLLATMESDKIAASRAIQQNRELKQQLESMQEVFMKMDNDKVVLTENFRAQQQTNKELIEKLQKTELTLQSLADAIEIKDKELTHLREAAEEMDRQVLHHEQLEDRLRHYEANDNSAHIIQHELLDAKQAIAKLTNELNNKKKEQEENGEPTKDGFIEPLEKYQNSSIEVHEGEFNQSDKSANVIDKENAMKYLEEKVKKTMQEIADLTDEKQRLEHIVLQLQGETEIIGEYVALYQHQRMVLNQKASEKDQQLKQLAADRVHIKIKLDRLNELIRRLVIEKGVVPAELLQHQESMNSQKNNFCEEHSKMNEEINKIKQGNVIEPESEVKNKTAEEIITLLSEIKTSNLVQPDENFHHCPWCSGQLITV